MRGGLERWKRGTDSHGVRAAIAYALEGRCDAHIRLASGVAALSDYSEADSAGVTRFTVRDGVISADLLTRTELERWVDGCDPHTGERRGRELLSPRADLVLDGTINAPKSYSLVAMIHPELAAAYEALQDRLRDRIIRTWQAELNARRGAGGRIREGLHQVEVVELRHRRSRALDPHMHRHLWLSVKVQGRDGAWSNVDSRVAMKLHTVINAEGELAACTDPQWITALARHGYTLDADGEVAQVAHVVRPLSRRSNQIEANRTMLLAEWREQHPGQEPDQDVLRQLDRLAWARNRPKKPSGLDEAEWEQLIRDELGTLDGDILHPRDPLAPHRTHLATIDRALMAARAIVDADARSAGCGGRFSSYDIRAGAIRALAGTGLIEHRDQLDAVISDITARSVELTVDLLPDEPARPPHVKGFMATMTAKLKVDLAARFDDLATPGRPVPLERVARVTAESGTDTFLDRSQLDAAAAIAGTDRLVTVTGPAGAGKTTMLRVARRILQEDRRRMVVVAPTKKAATVAGHELGTTASSLHALLFDHGWRWARDPAGAENWTRLYPGDHDPVTGHKYAGPRIHLLTAGDRIVVDEAGMVDLHTAKALAVLAEETGSGVAMVGDHLQAMPVGHSGAMAIMTRRATAVVELTAVHRFHDSDYAALTIRLREPTSPDDALAIATQLDERGHVHRVTDGAAAREAMTEAFFRWTAEHKRVALVTSTNDEADTLNETIQQRRVDLGQLSTRRVAVGQGEQRILEGDIVQTRRNNTASNVENRALWTVKTIRPDSIDLVSVTDRGDRRTVPTSYVNEHVHLAYASTVHGIQGETTDVAIVGPGVDASGLYVGMTRGRIHNEAIAIARTPEAARQQVADSMLRGQQEVTIDDSIRAATVELHRAARTSETGPSPLEDPKAKQLRNLDDWIASTQTLLRDIHAAQRGEDANRHCRAQPALDSAADAEVLRELTELLTLRVQERDEMMPWAASPARAGRSDRARTPRAPFEAPIGVTTTSRIGPAVGG